MYNISINILYIILVIQYYYTNNNSDLQCREYINFGDFKSMFISIS